MFNQKKEQKKMKKFWNLMLAALVIFGAVACTENQEENVPQAELKPVLSFVANIANDETRTHIEKNDEGVWETKWDGTETLYVQNADNLDEVYVFEHSETEKNVFNCYDDGVNALITKPVYVYNRAYIDSTAGQDGAKLHTYEAEFNPTATISLAVQSAFFHFTAEQEVTLTASEDIFGDENCAVEGYVNTMTFSAGEHWVAFLPCECTFSYSIAGVTYKEIKDKTFEAKKIYNLGTLAPIYNVYVLPQPKSAISKWTKFNLYTWWGEGQINNSWPGVDITANTKEINGYTYYAYQYPVEYNGQIVSVIVNNGSDQTADIKLGELNTDYYVVVNSVSESTVYTTAPAAGSVPEAKVVEDPKPDTVSLYLKTTWGWTNWALYAWGGSGSWGSFGSWPGKSKYDATIDGVTYKAWDIPASCVGQTGTQIIVTGKENGGTKQSVDFPVSFKAGEDVFIEISSWNGSLNKCELKTIASPYTK